jgi:hypothetical protein
VLGGTHGDWTVNPDEIPGEWVEIRLPGDEWGDSLNLSDIPAGTYTVEVKDKDGNTQEVTITITDQSVAKGFWNIGDKQTGWLAKILLSIWTWIGAALLILLALLKRNMHITIYNAGGRRVSSVKYLKRRQKEVAVTLNASRLKDGVEAKVRLSRFFTRRMRGNNSESPWRTESADCAYSG